MIVKIGLTLPPAFSSKVTISQLLWRGAHRAYRSKCFFIQRSPVRIGAIVHAVTHVRAHERHGRQLAIVAREGCEWPVGACRQRAEVDPRIVLAHVAPPIRIPRKPVFGKDSE